MATLYYGNGTCEIEGAEIKGVEIRYRGAITIYDKTADGFSLMAVNNGIIIFPTAPGDNVLTELFEYIGEFRITSVIVADSNAENVPTSVKRVSDYAELLKTTAEKLTVISEDMKESDLSGKRVSKTTIAKKTIPDQHTENFDGTLRGDMGIYSGYFHIHLDPLKVMTGATHTKESKNLTLVLDPRTVQRRKAERKFRKEQARKRARGR